MKHGPGAWVWGLGLGPGPTPPPGSQGGGTAEPPEPQRKGSRESFIKKEGEGGIGFPTAIINSFPMRCGTQIGDMSTTNRALSVMFRPEDEKYFVHIVWCRGKQASSLLLTNKCLSSLSLFPQIPLGH